MDLDRLDDLRRDSLYTGAGYGNFDWHRLITSMQLHGDRPNRATIVWPDKAKLAIEEYIFARYYMYQNVYLHKTTRGFEKMLEAMWRHARQLHKDGLDAELLPAIATLWGTSSIEARQYLEIEEFTVLYQIQKWTSHPDVALSDLARRFLSRRPFAMIEAPPLGPTLDPDLSDWEQALQSLVAKKQQYKPPQRYCLIDSQKPKYHLPYIAEKEDDEQSFHNAILLILPDSEQLMEISRRLNRLRAFSQHITQVVRYYVPQELKSEALALRQTFATHSTDADPAG